MKPIKLSEKLEPIYEAFISDVQGFMSSNTEPMEMWIGHSEHLEYALFVRLRAHPRGSLAMVNADMFGGAQAVAKLVEEKVLEYWPDLYGTSPCRSG